MTKKKNFKLNSVQNNFLFIFQFYRYVNPFTEWIFFEKGRTRRRKIWGRMSNGFGNITIYAEAFEYDEHVAQKSFSRQKHAGIKSIINILSPSPHTLSSAKTIGFCMKCHDTECQMNGRFDAKDLVKTKNEKRRSNETYV